MSLDVYLKVEAPVPVFVTGIFIRENGMNREITREQWDVLNPGVEPFVAEFSEATQYVFSANITHNLGTMAEEAGLYQCVWRPDEHGFTRANQIIEPLQSGIAMMKQEPDRFKKYNAKNGWGLYEHFVPWLERYLEACKAFPEAAISVSR